MYIFETLGAPLSVDNRGYTSRYKNARQASLPRGFRDTKSSKTFRWSLLLTRTWRPLRALRPYALLVVHVCSFARILSTYGDIPPYYPIILFRRDPPRPADGRRRIREP